MSTDVAQICGCIEDAQSCLEQAAGGAAALDDFCPGLDELAKRLLPIIEQLKTIVPPEVEKQARFEQELEESWEDAADRASW